MRHVDDTHDAEGDGQPDSREEVDRGQRNSVEQQVEALVEADACFDGVEGVARSIGHCRVRFVEDFDYGKVSLLRGVRPVALCQRRREGWYLAGCRETVIGRAAGGIGVQRGNRRARDLTVFDVLLQRRAQRRAGHRFRHDTGRYQQRLRKIGRVVRIIRQQSSGHVRVIRHIGHHLQTGGQNGIERCTGLDAETVRQRGNGSDPLFGRLSELGGQQPHQCLLAGLQRGIRFVLDRALQRRQLLGLGIAFDGLQGRSAPLGVGVGELELHQRHGDDRTHPGIRFELLDGFLVHRIDAVATVDVDERVGFVGLLLCVEKEVVRFAHPDFLGLPLLKKSGHLRQAAVHEIGDDWIDGLARGALNVLLMNCQYLLQRLGARGGRAQQKTCETCAQKNGDNGHD